MERLTESDFSGSRLKRAGSVGVCFAASWCPFCVAFLPRFRELGTEGGFALAIADLSSEENPLWERFDVHVVPTIVAFRDGEVLWRRDGVYGEGLGASDLRDLREAFRAVVPPGRTADPGRKP